MRSVFRNSVAIGVGLWLAAAAPASAQGLGGAGTVQGAVKDATGGFRVYRAATLRKIDLNGIESAGYCFQIDMTLRVLQAGMTIKEVPITFVERERGASKMSRTVIFEAFARVARWGISARLHGHSAASIRR